MPPSSFFDRLRPGTEQQRAFQSWPPPPPVRPVPAGKIGAQAAFPLHSQTSLNPDKYRPAVVVGLGATGERVLRQWLEQLSQDPAGPQRALRVILVTGGAVEDLPKDRAIVRHFDLSDTSMASGSFTVVASPRSRREDQHQKIRSHAIHSSLKTYLYNCLADLQRNVQVVVVGSLAEPAIGMMGDVLQLLQVVRGAIANPYRSVTALLSLYASTPALSLEPAEIFAALREVGRLTFSDWHWMGPPPRPEGGRPADEMVRSALLDHLFLVDNQGRSRDHPLDLSETPFDKGVGRALSEALFTLLHPSAQTIWEHLSLAASQAGEARQQHHETVVSALGVATLQIPLAELQDYVAARLARAVLYGEQPHAVEGLLGRSPVAVDYHASAGHLARHWLRAGPCAHPFFDWLLDLDDPAGLRFFPNVQPQFVEAFLTQLAHGLTAFLNDPAQPDRLEQAAAAVHALKLRLQQVNGWLPGAPSTPQNVAQRAASKYVLDRLVEALAGLEQHLGEWQRALEPAPQAISPGGEWRSGEDASTTAEWRVESPPQAASDWRDAAPPSAPADWRSPLPTPVPASFTDSKPPTPRPQSQLPTGSLSERIRQRLHAAQSRLSEAARERICRALTADYQRGLSEVEKYYADSVRPELSRRDNLLSRDFTQVRDRLGWWAAVQRCSVSPNTATLGQGSRLELCLVCLPAHEAGLGEKAPPPETARFSASRMADFEHTLLSLAALQTQHLLSDLTGPWFQRRLSGDKDHREGDLSRFFLRANGPFLRYDQGLAASHLYGSARHAYLIARDKTLTGNLKTTIFPDFHTTEIDELDGGDPARLTALAFWHNVPISALDFYHETRQRYDHQEQAHFYPQELLATRYERRFRSIQAEREVLPPDFTLALVDEPLVTLFCQALIHGLVAVETNPLDGKRTWRVAGLPSSDPRQPFPPLNLASADSPDGLWQAFHQFVLVLPNEAHRDQNPTHPFHHARREKYLRALSDAAHDRARQPDAGETRRRFETTLLAEWQRRGEQDARARAFAYLLAVELDRPMWKGW